MPAVGHASEQGRMRKGKVLGRQHRRRKAGKPFSRGSDLGCRGRLFEERPNPRGQTRDIVPT
jgi:hypothetical protein